MGPLALAGILAALIGAIPPGLAHASFPGGNGRIAYTAVDGSLNAPGIFTALPDGSGTERLTDIGVSSSWSADGRAFAFSAIVDGRCRILTVGADGEDLTQIAPAGQGPGCDAAPSFSPSGNRIVYTTMGAIHTIRVDGTDRRRILRAPRGVEGPCCAYDPRWAPNGNRIAFARGPQGGPAAGIYTVRPNGSGLRRLTEPKRPEWDLAPDYSPDGRRIVATRISEGIVTMRADGSHEREVSPELPYPYYLSRYASYSPSGDRLVITAYGLLSISHTSDCSDVYTTSLDGSDVQFVTDNCTTERRAFAHSPAWQPVPG